MTALRANALLLLLAALLALAMLPAASGPVPRRVWPPAPYGQCTPPAMASCTPRPTVVRAAKVWPGTATPHATATRWPTNIYIGPTVEGDRWGY